MRWTTTDPDSGVGRRQQVGQLPGPGHEVGRRVREEAIAAVLPGREAECPGAVSGHRGKAEDNATGCGPPRCHGCSLVRRPGCPSRHRLGRRTDADPQGVVDLAVGQRTIDRARGDDELTDKLDLVVEGHVAQLLVIAPDHGSQPRSHGGPVVANARTLDTPGHPGGCSVCPGAGSGVRISEMPGADGAVSLAERAMMEAWSSAPARSGCRSR